MLNENADLWENVATVYCIEQLMFNILILLKHDLRDSAVKPAYM